MLALARGLGASPWAASLAGLGYAFGAPVLYQHCNIIYLVGAAWMPWGLLAVDRLVRLGRRTGVVELAVVLALQVLGGDPQAAYLTVACGVGLAVTLALRARAQPERSGFAWVLPAASLVGVWAGATLACAYGRLTIPGWVGPIWVPGLLGWVVFVGWSLARRNRGGADGLGSRIARLFAAAALAVVLSAGQLLPAAEFAAAANRSAEAGTLSHAKFSTEPFRLVECLWPGVFGARLPENRTWIQAIPPVGDRQLWEPSLYVGGLIFIVVLGSAGFRGGFVGRPWLSALALVGLAAGFGRFGGVLFWARAIPGVAATLGPHDPLYSLPRRDAFLEDAAGSPYLMLGALLPGFGLFRYSSKLLTLAAVAAAALAGLGWDEAMTGRSRRFARLATLGLALSLVALVLAVVLRVPILSALAGRLPADPYTGPADAAAAWSETVRSLVHAAVACGAALALFHWGPARPRVAGLVGLAVLSADLAVANSRLVATAPQALFDDVPELVRTIRDTELVRSALGPFRFHRMPLWHPERFLRHRSPGRVAELVAWERKTLQGLHGMAYGLEAVTTAGVLELDDYFRLFQPRLASPRGDVAAALGVRPDRPIVYYPRRMFDLWGARYFALPVRADGWGTDPRGYAAFVPDSEIIGPALDRLDAGSARTHWAATEDWQLLRNRDAYPRAWVVHRARVVPPAHDAVDRQRRDESLAFQNDPLWSDRSRTVLDPRTTALIETERPEALRGFLTRDPVASGESVTVSLHEPQRVALRAVLNRPGVVILADAYYPGWRLTIDGKPAPILRVNRMMRGAAVPKGTHQLIYTYDPLSFRTGATLSVVGLVVVALILGRIWSPFGRRGSATSFSGVR